MLCCDLARRVGATLLCRLPITKKNSLYALHRLGPVDPRLLQTQDFELWIRLCLLFEVSMVDETLVAYRIRARQANMDANTPDKLPRILEIFLSWTDRDLFLRVLPEAKVHLDRGLSLRSALALMALQSPASWTRSFGIEALYRELGDPAAVDAFGRSGYHFPDFFRLLAEVDPTRAKALEDITQRLISARDWAQSQADARANELEDITQRLTSARDWAQSQADAWEARAGELEVKYQEAIRPKGLVHWLRTRLGV